MSFPGPRVEVNVGDIAVRHVVDVGCHVRINDVVLEFGPVFGADGARVVTPERVDTLVPDGVHFVGLVVVRDRECVSTGITIRVVVVEARGRVERLRDVAEEVDKQAQGVRPGYRLVARVQPVLDVVIDVGLLVAIPVLAREPVGDLSDALSQVPSSNFLGFRVVSSRLALLVNVRVVDVVEVALPAASVVLNIISEGGALDEGVCVFPPNEFGVRFLKRHQFGNGGVQGVDVVGGEEVLGNVGNGQVAIDGVSLHSCEARGNCMDSSHLLF